MTCAACLAKELEPDDSATRHWWPIVQRTLQVIASVFILWFIFATLGHLLVQFPSTFHDRAFWEGGMEDME
jgi:hypothetical protein